MADTASPANDPLHPFRALEPGHVTSPEHDAWMQAEIRRTLDAKSDGRMIYKPLAEVARRFTSDAC